MTSRTGNLLALALAASLSLAQAPQRFEVASVKPSTGCGNDGGGRNAGGGGSGGMVSPVSLDLKCRTVMDLVRMAYVQFADGKRRAPGGQDVPISGGPAWADSDRYDIDAKAESPQNQEMLRGPMLQTLLEDRFKLKIHRETREVPVYALTVAKGGPKIAAAQEGKCTPKGEQRQPGLFTCGVFAPSAANDGAYMYGTTLENFCAQLSVVLDRAVIDRTGIAGTFDIYVETGPRSGDPAAPGRASLSDSLGLAILNAVRKVGLKLEPAKGAGEFRIIDRVERPSGN